jgi:hypothetical protein
MRLVEKPWKQRSNQTNHLILQSSPRSPPGAGRTFLFSRKAHVYWAFRHSSARVVTFRGVNETRSDSSHPWKSVEFALRAPRIRASARPAGSWSENRPQTFQKCIVPERRPRESSPHLSVKTRNNRLCNRTGDHHGWKQDFHHAFPRRCPGRSRRRFCGCIGPRRPRRARRVCDAGQPGRS